MKRLLLGGCVPEVKSLQEDAEHEKYKDELEIITGT